MTQPRTTAPEAGALAGKTVLVTGATSGIGLAVARRLVDEGAHVFITGRRRAELDDAAAQLGPMATGIRADASDLDDLDRVFAAIEERGAGLDALHANAGGGEFAGIDDLSPESFDTTFATNVRGTVFTVQKALPLLHEGGSIVVTGSTAASGGRPAFGIYGASKAAVHSFARTWAVELAGRGIRVNLVVPGPTETPGLAGLASTPDGAPALLAHLAGEVPLGRLIRPDEVADVVQFLMSDSGRMITGTEIFIDGGETARRG